MRSRMTAPSARRTVLIENELTRVTEWSFAKKGDNTSWHKHEYDYVVVPLFDGFLDVDTGDEIIRSPVSNGGAYFRGKGVQHDVMNGNDFPCRFIEVEFLNTGD